MRRFEANISVWSIFVHVIVWALLTLVTLGLAIFFYPYAFGRVLLNNAYVLDEGGRRVGRLRCDVSPMDEIGHILVWFLISVVTFGVGMFFYWFKAFGVVLNNTTIEPLGAVPAFE
ncbi:MAG TPA: DUF6693 family protein [Polyangiaceae bacterium]|nr:DUF6693 family protein [Polyangiaceae bacterium]